MYHQSKFVGIGLKNLLICGLLSACSAASTPSSSSSANPATPAGTVPALALNGCSSYVDKTAADADRSLSWEFAIASNPNHCMKIKAGQTVTFKGSFTSHPLIAAGGDAANPFSSAQGLVQKAGVAGEENTPVVFSAAGTFGYKCSLHASMTGAIVVVP